MGNVCSSSSKKSKDIDQSAEGKKAQQKGSDAAAAEKDAEGKVKSSTAPSKDASVPTAQSPQSPQSPQPPTKALGQDMQITQEDLRPASNVPSRQTNPISPDQSNTGTASKPVPSTAVEKGTASRATPQNVIGTPAPVTGTTAPTQDTNDITAGESTGAAGAGRAHNDAESEFYSATEEGDETILDGSIPSGFNV